MLAARFVKRGGKASKAVVDLVKSCEGEVGGDVVGEEGEDPGGVGTVRRRPLMNVRL